MVETLLVISQIVLLGGVLYFLFISEKRNKEHNKEISEIYSNSISKFLSFFTDENKKLYEMVGKMQIEHFKELEKQSSKQFQEMGKQTEKILKHFEQKTEKEVIKPLPFMADSVENTIEKEDLDEIPLDAMDRIPMVNGINLKFEDKEEIYPINIESTDQYNA